MKENPEVILLNSVGKITEEKPIKIFGYNIHSRNYADEEHAGIAVAVRRDIKYQLMDDYMGDALPIKIETTQGPVIILTTYVPPRR